MKLQHLLSHEMLDGSAWLLESSLNCYTCLQGPISLTMTPVIYHLFKFFQMEKKLLRLLESLLRF